MHTFKNGYTTFHYNSDLSGIVTITDHAEHTCEVPGKDLLAFIIQYVRGERISRIEDMSDCEVLGL